MGFSEKPGIAKTEASLLGGFNSDLAAVPRMLDKVLGGEKIARLRLLGRSHSIFSFCPGIIHDAANPTAQIVIQHAVPYDAAGDENAPAFFRAMVLRRGEGTSAEGQEERYTFEIRPSAPSMVREQDGLLIAIKNDGNLDSIVAGRKLMDPAGRLHATGSENIVETLGLEAAAALARHLILECLKHAVPGQGRSL